MTHFKNIKFRLWCASYISLAIFVLDNILLGWLLHIFVCSLGFSRLLLPTVNTCDFSLTKCTRATEATVPTFAEPRIHILGWHLTNAWVVWKHKSIAPLLWFWTIPQSSPGRSVWRHLLQNWVLNCTLPCPIPTFLSWGHFLKKSPAHKSLFRDLLLRNLT